jgi:hypothetical protein
MVEKGGLIVAAISTVAATLGEILAVRALMRKEHDKARQKVDAAAAAAVEALERAERSERAAAAEEVRLQAATVVFEAEVAGDQADTCASNISDKAAAAAGVEEDGTCGWRWDDGGERRQDLSGQQKGGSIAAELEVPASKASSSKQQQG